MYLCSDVGGGGGGGGGGSCFLPLKKSAAASRIESLTAGSPSAASIARSRSGWVRCGNSLSRVRCRAFIAGVKFILVSVCGFGVRTPLFESI